MPSQTISSLSTTSAPPTAGSTGGAGAPGAAPTVSVNALFAQLKEFQWKGVSFPVTETELEIRQDLVIHRYADRNGAYVEGTGRHPVQITARIPFLNTIYSAANETWAQGALYPYQWRLFIKACLDGTSGTLQHPELGSLTCKIDVSRTTWSGVVRAGVIVQATWIESDDTQADQLGVDLSTASPIANLVASADDLDANIETLQSAVTAQQNPLPPLQFSFDSLASAIVGAVDTQTVLDKEFQGRTDNLIYQCNRVEQALSQSGAASPLNWPIFDSCEKLKEVAFALKAAPQVAQKRPIQILTVQKDSTIGQLIAQTGSVAEDFIALNTTLMGLRVVPNGTPVRYYAAAA